MHKDLNYSISLIRDFYKLCLHKEGRGQIKAILGKLFGCEVYDMEGDGVKKYCNYANAIYVICTFPKRVFPPVWSMDGQIGHLESLVVYSPEFTREGFRILILHIKLI